MAEQSIVHRGWLTTRDGEKYAPATLISNVFSNDGTSYDTKIKQYIAQEQNKFTTSLETVNNNVSKLESEFDGAVQKLTEENTEIKEKLINFGDTQDDTLYIIDKDSNVIAYVNHNGVTSIDFNIPQVTTLKTIASSVSRLEENIVSVNDKIANIGMDYPDAFYIIDSQENVIAYINGEGIHSTNFIIGENNSDYADYLSLLAKVEEHIQDIQQLKETDSRTNESLQSLSNSVDERLKNFDGNDDTAFYFIDSSEEQNVIAYINETGIHTTGLFLAEQGINVQTVLNIYNESGEVIAYINDDGVHSSNFIIHNSDGVVHNINTVLASLISKDSQLEGAIATLSENITTETGKLQEEISKTNARTEFIDGTSDDKFYIVDQQNNVVGYFGNGGLYVTDVKVQGVVKDENNVYSIAATGTEESIKNLSNIPPISLNDQIVDLQTRMSNKTSRIASLEDRMNHVTKVMSFEGVKETKPDPKDYQPGDVIVVSTGEDSGKEFVLDETLGWVEIGYSDYTATAIANLQGVIGRTTGLNQDENTHDERLTRLDNLVGKATDISNAGATASHEARIKSLQEQITTEVNKRQEDILAANEDIDILQRKTEFLDASSNNTFYIIDGTADENVLGYFDENGLTITDVRLQGIIANADGTYSKVNAQDENVIEAFSIINELVNILNKLKENSDTLTNHANRLNVQEQVTGETVIPSPGQDHKSRLDSIDALVGKTADTEVASTHEGRIKALKKGLTAVENKLTNVSNVMDFIGTFNTKSELDAYATPHSGDVAIVLADNTEYIYCTDDSLDAPAWIELGNSKEALAEITNLQAVIGASSLASGEKSHKERLDAHDIKLQTLENATPAGSSGLNSAINYRGTVNSESEITSPTLGDIATINNTLKMYNYTYDKTTDTQTTSWQDFVGLSHKLYNIDGTDDNTLYVMDAKGNVIAYFDDKGFSVINVRVASTLTASGFITRTQMVAIPEITKTYTW